MTIEGVTETVATALVTAPNEFASTAVKSPPSERWTLVSNNADPAAPGTSESFRRHWQVMGTEPVKLMESKTLEVINTDWLAGCFVMSGAELDNARFASGLTAVP